MADLSVTLSSPQGTSRPPLALPLKDIVELARTIDRSLAKDFPDAQSIAAEVLETVEQIKEFCDHNYVVLDDSVDSKKIIFDLLRELKVASDQIREFLTSSNQRKSQAFLSARRDSSRIEASLLQLRNRVNKYHTQIMMFAVVGADNQIFIAGQSNARALAAIQQQISTSWVTDERIVSFLGSNIGTLTQLPPSITTFYIADSYIRMQINTIDEQLNELSSAGSYPVEEPIEAYLLPYQPVIVSHSTEDGATLRQDVIAKIQEIQDLVRNDSSTVSIQTGAWEMVNLCTALYSLDMFQEAATMGLWTVNLFRTLVSTDAEVYSPYLSHSLRHLSWFYAKIDDLDGAERAIDEASRISRRLYKTSKELEVRAQIVPVLTMAAYVASLKGNHGRAIEHAEEGVQIFELLIDQNKPANAPTDLQLIRTEEEWAEALVNFPDQAICNYSRGLQQLSTSLQDNGRLADAVAAQTKATTIMSFISRYYPDGALEPELGDMLYRLSHQDFHDIVPYEEALEYSKQAVEIYRRLSEKSPQRYGRPLCNALWEQANILGKLERYDAALGVWKETADLAKDIMADQLYHANALEQVSWSFRRLKRHDEAAATRSESVKVYHSVLNASSITEAHAYYDLAVDFQLAERFPEAIEAAEMALTQYRALAFSDPEKYTKNVAKGLNNLTGILISAKDTNRAFNEGHEALKLYEKLIEDDDANLNDYLRCLSLNSLVSLVAENHEKCLERIVDVLQHSREVNKRFPTKPEEDSVLVRAIRNHAQILTNMGRLDEGCVVIREALEWYEKNPPTHPKPAQQYMECLIDIGSFLDNQGFTEQALEPITKSAEVGKQFADNAGIASLIVGAMHRRAQLFLELGQFEDGVKASEEAVKLARETTMDNIADFIGCLQVQSMAYKYTGKHEEAIVAINEAIELCHGDALAELTKTRGVLLLNLPQCLQQLSGNIAVAGRESEALPIAQEAVDISLALKGKHVTLPWIEIEPVYMAALYNLCLRLAANDQLEKALDLVVQCREYSAERSKSRKGILTFLACIIRAEAILFCAAGRHEEGVKARTSLEDLMKGLWNDDPSLAKLVEIEVDSDKALPSWIELVKKLDLKCDHQDND